jgi:hypothetical protein
VDWYNHELVACVPHTAASIPAEARRRHPGRSCAQMRERLGQPQPDWATIVHPYVV